MRTTTKKKANSAIEAKRFSFGRVLYSLVQDTRRIFFSYITHSLSLQPHIFFSYNHQFSLSKTRACYTRFLVDVKNIVNNGRPARPFWLGY